MVYGSIIGLALVLALEAEPPDTRFIIASLWATAVAVGFAEFYSEWVGRATRSSLGIESEPWRVSAEDAAGVAFGIAFPSVFFVIATLGWVDISTAFSLATWTGMALIGSYGYVAARLSGSGIRKALLQATSLGLLALMLILFKSLLL